MPPAPIKRHDDARRRVHLAPLQSDEDPDPGKHKGPAEDAQHVNENAAGPLGLQRGGADRVGDFGSGQIVHACERSDILECARAFALRCGGIPAHRQGTSQPTA